MPAGDLPDWTKSVDVTAGTIDVGTITGPVTVEGTVTADLAAGSSVIIEPGTSPIDISGPVTATLAAGSSVVVEPGTSPIDISGPVTVTSGSVTVDGTVTADLAAGSTVIVEPGTSPIDISGTVDVGSITAGSITIVEGQGGLTNVSTQTPSSSPGTVTIPAGQKGGLLTFTPGAGCTAVGVIVYGAPALALTVTGITAKAATSGTDYMGNNLGGLTLQEPVQYITAPLPAALDGAIAVTVDVLFAPGADTVIATVVEYFGQAAVQPTTTIEQPLLVQGVQARGASVPTDVVGTGPEAEAWQGGVGGFPAASIDQVVAGDLALRQNAAAAPSFDLLVGGNQGATSKSVQTVGEAAQFSAVFDTASSTVFTIAGVAGKSIHIRQIRLWCSAATICDLKDGTTVVDHIVSESAAGSVEAHYVGTGKAITAGASCTLITETAATSVGSVDYDQY